MASTEERIEKIIIDKLGLDASTLTPDTSFKTNLHIDSLDMIEVIVAIEKEFNIAIPDEDIEKIQTMRQAADYVNKTRRLVF